MTCALAIFVKTPGYSKIKTRLAKDIGNEKAQEFYLLSVKATEVIVKKSISILAEGLLDPFWAIAEKQALTHPFWHSFDCVDQGDGDLSKRLFCVYDTLLKSYKKVVLIGADSPQLDPMWIVKAVLSKAPFTIGPTQDGGFYLWAGTKPISLELWKQVPFSTLETAKRLMSVVKHLGKIETLPMSLDVDEKEGLQKLFSFFSQNPPQLFQQKKLQLWLQKKFFKKRS